MDPDDLDGALKHALQELVDKSWDPGALPEVVADLIDAVEKAHAPERRTHIVEEVL